MPGAIFLLYLCATAAVPVCIVVGLLQFAVPKSRGFAPYVGLVYPATYCGGFLGAAAVLRFGALVRTSAQWWQQILLLAFFACLLGGAGMGGFLGYKLADRIAKHFPGAS
jgi:hypothetical protein